MAHMFGQHAEKPQHPDIHYLFAMIMNVRIRQEYIEKFKDPLTGFMIMMKNEFDSAEVDYQMIREDVNHN